MTQRDQRLWYQVEKIRHRKMGWGQITWTPAYLRVLPNHQVYDKNVAEFLLACVWFAKGSTG